MDSKTASVMSDYEAVIKEHGVGTPGGLGWSSKVAQEVRFQAIMDELRGYKGTMLDVGCGVGDIVNQPGFANVVTEYYGLDLQYVNIERASTTFKKANNVNFAMGDIHDWDYPQTGFPRKFDIVVASGLFQHYPPWNIGKMLSRIWNLTNHVLVFNVMVPRTLPTYYDLITIMQQARIEMFSLRHDYLVGDVTVKGIKMGDSNG